jgi:predicted kinase
VVRFSPDTVGGAKMGKEADTANRYRMRAEELRVIAGTIKDRTNREILIKMAEDYEERADLVMETEKIIPFPGRVQKRNDLT